MEAATLTGRAAESLAGPWAVEAYDNMADAYCVEGQVPDEGLDEYPHYDHARHAVRARAVERVPEMLSLLGRAGELAGSRTAQTANLDELCEELASEIGELFAQLNGLAESAESGHPREVT